jgi:hypothetical protein
LPANGHHPPFQVRVDYEAVRARKRAALDKESAELAASISARPHPLPSSSAYTRVVRHAKAVAGPSRISLDDHSRTADKGASNHEVQLLMALAGGDGISPYDNQGFIEECGICHRFFLGSVLNSHIFSCSRN